METSLEEIQKSLAELKQRVVNTDTKAPLENCISEFSDLLETFKNQYEKIEQMNANNELLEPTLEEEASETVAIETSSEFTEEPSEDLEETIEESVDKSELTPTIDNLDKILDENPEPNIVQAMTYYLKNAMVNVDYEFELAQLDLTDIVITDVLLSGETSLNDIGLEFSLKENTITGRPNCAGEFDFNITYDYTGYVNPNRELILEPRSLKLTVIPDPKSLWQENEPEEGSPFFKDHFHFDHLTFHGFQIYGGSLRGRSHAHAGTFRDDHFIIDTINDRCAFLAVADGAGSAKFSREGSKIACETSFQTVKEILNESFDGLSEKLNEFKTNPKDEDLVRSIQTEIYNLLGSAVRDARNNLISSANENGHDLKDYSTTLLFTIIVKLDYGYSLISYGIGDGVIAYTQNEIKLLSKPD
ncbi:MAG: protein phosphatase 2C domain-containing protein, partial [Flavobacteriales bacterium]|nr:protein phosphatase 2C domain-containing protein [Flavobacteriales bacterium]